jgi:hypothetical protein
MEQLLLRHGQRIRPEYAASDGEIDGIAGSSTAEHRPDGLVNGIVKRLEKGDEATCNPLALGWLKTVYRDAIEYTGMKRELHGVGLVLAAIFGTCCSAGASAPFLFGPSFDDWAFGILSVLQVGIFSAFAAYFVARGLRMVLFVPIDLPIIFDRRHRKVYRILREEDQSAMGQFRPWPIKVCEYEWDLIDAEHNAEIFTTGASISRNHYLMFVVRKSADDPTIIDSFQIANANELSEELVPCMWEHIRRFMEEGGPHLPTKNEPLARQNPPQSWWQCCGEVGAFGPRYFHFWRAQQATG